MKPVNGIEAWQRVRRSLAFLLLLELAVGSGVAFWFWGLKGALAFALSLLCLASGFWLTEMLIGVFTRVKTANPAAISLLVSGKVLWWAALFLGARRLPPQLGGAVALGVGAFLTALFFSSIRHCGIPRISDGNPP